jgi:hypothetical protein
MFSPFLLLVREDGLELSFKVLAWGTGSKETVLKQGRTEDQTWQRQSTYLGEQPRVVCFDRTCASMPLVYRTEAFWLPAIREGSCWSQDINPLPRQLRSMKPTCARFV